MIDICKESLGSGISIGKCYVLSEKYFDIPEDGISAGRVESEIDKFNEAVELTSKKIRKMMKFSSSKIDHQLLHSKFRMLTDPEFNNQVVSFIKKAKQSAAQSILMAINAYLEKIKNVSDPYLSERAEDFEEIRSLLLSCLFDKNSHSDFSHISQSIVVASNILFSEVLTFAEHGCIGFVLGAAAAHVYLALESVEVPSIINAHEIVQGAETGDEIILDGNTGRLILNPNTSLRESYLVKKEKSSSKTDVPVSKANKIKTTDGVPVSLQANLMFASDVDRALSSGVTGVGLFRTEFSYLKNIDARSEISQYSEYKDLLINMGRLPVTVRTLDLGGEKQPTGRSVVGNSNPLLGIRGIRYSHANIDLFKSHLKALLRASVFGNLRIMFPFISCLEELLLSLSILKEIQNEYDIKKIKYRKVPIGMMIEVPSAANCIDLFSPYIDFVSLGTNDLFQYLTAVDRSQNELAYLKRSVHPALTRVLYKVVSAAKFHRISISVCGELASEPNMIGLFLGMGIRNFSMHPTHIQRARKEIRRFSYANCQKLADSIFQLSTQEQVMLKMKNWNYYHA